VNATAAIRQVSVERLSLSAEFLQVLRLGMTIVLGVWLYLAASLGHDTNARRGLLPYQALVESRSPSDQRMFRELQEGLLEAQVVRSSQGSWPAAEALGEQGVPPFAPDPTRSMRYSWHMERDGNYVNYVGLPQQDGPAWLLLVQEPEPGVPPDQAFEDEEHHRLLDGTMLHVSAWSRSDARTGSRVVRVPQVEGWTQLYAVGPGAGAAVAPPSAPGATP
jgi:hypothetical protein